MGTKNGGESLVQSDRRDGCSRVTGIKVPPGTIFTRWRELPPVNFGPVPLVPFPCLWVEKTRTRMRTRRTTVSSVGPTTCPTVDGSSSTIDAKGGRVRRGRVGASPGRRPSTDVPPTPREYSGRKGPWSGRGWKSGVHKVGRKHLVCHSSEPEVRLEIVTSPNLPQCFSFFSPLRCLQLERFPTFLLL